MIQTLFHWRMIGKLPVYDNTLPDFLGNFSIPSSILKIEVCPINHDPNHNWCWMIWHQIIWQSLYMTVFPIPNSFITRVSAERPTAAKRQMTIFMPLSTHFCLKWKKVWKISLEFWKYGVVSWHIACHAPVKLSLDHYVQVRYGNPDMQILGTLKIKLQIFRFLSILSKNMRSNLIFRVAIYFSLPKLGQTWEPWLLNYF